ncbi:MAG: hypothetical protein AAB422_07830, partial [Planctomycetota bacterium]
MAVRIVGKRQCRDTAPVSLRVNTKIASTCMYRKFKCTRSGKARLATTLLNVAECLIVTFCNFTNNFIKEILPMKWTQTLIPTLKESPSEAEIDSHK